MLVNDALADLSGVHERHRSESVDFTRQTGREVKNSGNGRIGEDIRGRIGRKSKMGGDVIGSLRFVKSGDMTAQVNTLGDCFISLPLENITDFRLTDEDKGHGAMRIHIKVKKEPNFGKHLHITQMSFVNNNDRLFVVGVDEENFFHELAFSIAAKESRFHPKLIQYIEIKITGSKT